ncbi:MULTISPECIES: purine-nucleoside phosphorylase [unclassified Thalassotalea]|uniref:purine-nucleoside phosphorylase n=1 Tax=unclassified Thalassotalea TaxID=2614972 RepID=UPI0010808739|nr:MULTISPECIES: purine-nucleoside phosphorylase [unclassified Thalassotalea]NMP15429.1 purine-nucleoside phosphorylase [Thalassotalea sp. Y01]QBY05923.1 purine-nucleoside phosphorylase [Thalassotalea sp. HSM 43]
MATPHIEAKEGEIAETVLLPGDPLRAKFIADNFLDDPVQFNAVRNMFGFTGSYKGQRVSVMGSGMGIPSASIYATELYKDYGVENIIRIGSCGAVREDINVMDVVIGMGACTDSKCNRMRFNDHDFSAIADYGLLKNVVTAAENLNIDVKVGNIFSADLFYTPDFEFFHTMAKLGILGVEMEAAGLYGAAAEYNKKALCVATVSDHIIRGEALSAEDRQTSFKDMMIMTLDSLLL